MVQVQEVQPTPGDPSTEPVATALQSHVDGRVGPPTIAQDADAEEFAPDGVEQVKPGAVLPADFAWQGGPLPEGDVQADAVPGDDEPQSQSSGPVKNDAGKATKRAG